MDARKQDLRQRTKDFAGGIIRLYCGLPTSRIEVAVIGKQMLRSGTSVAANYREASRARSNGEFTSKIELCSQEADETQLWLELLRDDCKIESAKIEPLWCETDELISIFVTMSKNTKRTNPREKLKTET
jgi:four helix bundle protein